jgi:hypothetical protein
MVSICPFLTYMYIGGYPLLERDILLELDYYLDSRYSDSSVRSYW